MELGIGFFTIESVVILSLLLHYCVQTHKVKQEQCKHTVHFLLALAILHQVLCTILRCFVFYIVPLDEKSDWKSLLHCYNDFYCFVKDMTFTITAQYTYDNEYEDQTRSTLHKCRLICLFAWWHNWSEFPNQRIPENKRLFFFFEKTLGCIRVVNPLVVSAREPTNELLMDEQWEHAGGPLVLDQGPPVCGGGRHCPVFQAAWTILLSPPVPHQEPGGSFSQFTLTTLLDSASWEVENETLLQQQCRKYSYIYI